ncbi:hypothetical protein [Streptomyces sp. H27-H5]|uniref:hypothetical protein n=1 Tax=Streptomyces sp. H27-H5 TaxID=2996460 RepID=UPI00226EA62F|nr:hypothetical protein [Streptomyces sp. H27-H5]MCY0961337.1 hypothetical protein [Streptomyces sp. H27-H5]
MSKNGAARIDVPREAPARAPLVLASLIIVAAVANLNLSVANVALPAIGKAFDSSQTALNMVAVGYSLGLAASVLYLGAVGDHHGRSRQPGGLSSVSPARLQPAWTARATAPRALACAAPRLRRVRSGGIAGEKGDHCHSIEWILVFRCGARRADRPRPSHEQQH